MEYDCQRDFGKFEYNFQYRYRAEKVNNRTRYLIKLSQELVMINYYATRRTLVKAGTRATKKLYEQNFLERLPTLWAYGGHMRGFITPIVGLRMLALTRLGTTFENLSL